MEFNKFLSALAVVLILSCFSQAEAGYFQRPVASFITDPGESTYEITFYNGDVSELQTQLADARSSHPNAVLIVHLRGRIKVYDMPLILGSKTCLSFEGCGTMIAETGFNSSALIHIENAEYVSVTAVEQTALAVLDGRGAAQTGILVSNSGKVNIDNINISDCTNYGVDYSGRGNSLLDDAGSLTRCEISDAGISGVRVRNSARFVLMDNEIDNCGSYGSDLASQTATILNNRCTGNQTGIRIDSPTGIDGPEASVTKNVLEQNSVGLELGAGTDRVLVFENVIENNTTGIKLNGTQNHLFNNQMNNASEFIMGGSDNIIVRNPNLTDSDVSGGSVKYFNPPTADNPHNDPVIVAGMGRHDITVNQSGGTPLSTTGVQATLDNARNQYPNDVIVLWMNGTFVADGIHTGLSLPDNTCVVLNGTIYPEGAEMDRNSDPAHYSKSSSTGGTQLILMHNSGYTSFSGGVLDCKDLCAYGIYAPRDNVALIDGVTIHDAVDNNIGTLNHSGFTTPVFINDCQLYGSNSTNRGVWLHQGCSNVHCISTYGEGFVADVYDFDAGAHWCSAFFSAGHQNSRTFVFIEEGASNNIIVGNSMTGSVGNGISLYDTNSSRKCYNNIIVANTVTGPYGINIRHATNTFAFNNIVTGQYGVYINVTGNYSAQNVSVDGIYNFHSPQDNPFFTAFYNSYENPYGDCVTSTNLNDFSALALGWLDINPHQNILFFEDFENLGVGNLDGQDGWSQFFTSGSMVVGSSSAIQGTQGIIGSVSSDYSSAQKLTGSSVNFATDDVTIYVAALVRYTGTGGSWLCALNTGSNNSAKLEARIRTSGCQFAGLYGYSDQAVPSWQADKVYAAVFKIDPINATQLRMSIGIFDVTSGLPDEHALTYTLVKTYDRTAANYNYNHLAVMSTNDTTMGDNVLIAADWYTIQAMVAGELANNWLHVQSDYNLDGVIDMNDLIDILFFWLD